MEMNNSFFKKIAERNWEVPTYVWEILILATITPALVEGVVALKNMPIV